MSKNVLYAAAVAALAVGTTPASAVVIDSFETVQVVQDLVSGDPGDGNQVAAPEAIGGWRDMYVQKRSDGGAVEGLRGTRAASGGGVLSFSNDSLVQGFGCVTWDGSYAGSGCDDVDTSGLGGFNLQSFGPGFDFEVIQVDQFLEFTMNIWDIVGGFSSYFETIPPVNQLETFLPFSDFEGNADFSQVGAIQIFVNAPVDDLDGSIGEINVVPLPASAFLLLGGLGGLAAFRARRKKA